MSRYTLRMDIPGLSDEDNARGAAAGLEFLKAAGVTPDEAFECVLRYDLYDENGFRKKDQPSKRQLACFYAYCKAHAVAATAAGYSGIMYHGMLMIVDTASWERGERPDRAPGNDGSEPVGAADSTVEDGPPT